ncbi:hypothetical protein BJ165DRAFT_1513510 [Panaeolus papilionaceus]|nr:hypothetical protein BJ165DRAFT_1513510 [Panaeolus papilionaceus]
MDINEKDGGRKKRKIFNGTEQPGFAESSGLTEGQRIQRGSVWMDDGNIVLQAGQTQFRVHKSMISRSSSVFKDMFSFPQPADSSSEVEGCPVVHLHDSDDDVACLLSAIYDHRYSGNPLENELTPVSTISSLLRLSNKYDIPLIRQNMLLRLRAEYPTSFKDMNFESDLTYIDISLAYLEVDILNLCHQEGAFSVLPLAFYHLLLATATGEIVAGLPQPDGRKATLLPCLIIQCLAGMVKLEEFMWESSYKWLRNHATDQAFCRKPTCRKVLNALAKQILRPCPDLADALYSTWKTVTDGTNTGLEDLTLCSVCDGAATKYHEEGRKAVFDNLPAFFGYESWDEVKQIDRYQI